MFAPQQIDRRDLGRIGRIALTGFAVALAKALGERFGQKLAEALWPEEHEDEDPPNDGDLSGPAS